MARRKTTAGSSSAAPAAADPAAGSEEIFDTDVADELSTSFLEYAMSVIVARALPDVRDGLKPVHRRILFSLYSQGIRPTSPYTKCARIVGDTMGKYHPHGDSAIYEALVRLAQPWAMRLPLVDGHGNFGSLDDGPAASRYTECRMANPALAMVEELAEDTVDMRPNYDGTESEPEVLPAVFPNLLVNGSTGIAVGMATNMAPHNLGEVVAGLKAMLADPGIGLDGLLAHIPGPDFPSGAIVAGLAGVRDAYTTGRGSFLMRAVARVEDVSPRRQGIVVTELPYNVGPEKVVARIKELVSAKKLAGVADVRDYSDRKTGLRLVIECKTGFNPHAVLDELYRLTPMQESFGVNNVALVDGQPRTLGLVDLCRLFLDHRVVVVRRRCAFRLRRAETRAHVLEGLIVALDAIDEVVALIKSSKDSATARAKLADRFTLSDAQADAILEMTLRRLTSLEVTRLRDELAELNNQIAELRRILGSDKALRALVGDELDRVSTAFATPRRTRLLAELPASAVEAAALEVPDDACLVGLSASGLVARFPAEAFTGRVWRHDVLVSQVPSTNRSTVGLVTSTGRLVRLSALEVPAASATTRGMRAADVFSLPAGDEPVGLVDARPGRVVHLICASGAVKRVASDEFPQRLDSRPVVGLRGEDRVVCAVTLPADVDADFIVVTSDAQLLRFSGSSVAVKGLAAGAMAGMRLGAGATVVGATVLPVADVDAAALVTVSDAGSVKVSALGDYPVKGRGTGGVRCHAFRKGESALTVAGFGVPVPVALGPAGQIVDIPSTRSRRDASGTPVDVPVTRFGFVRHI